MDSLKRELKARGITYADVAARIGMSEATVKRMFSQKNFTLQRLDEILQATQIDFRDIALAGHDESRLISELSHAQEKEIIGDIRLFIVAVSVLNQLTLAQIVQVYRMTEAEVVQCLLRLDRIGIIELLPNNRVKLLVSRTFRWIPDGPIQTHFREQAYGDYLDAQFDGDHELLRLVNVMLSKKSIAALLDRLQQLAREFSLQHQEDARLPFEDRYAISMLLAARPWLPKSFQAMLREKPGASRTVRRK
ncbi:MAG TPA: helix-turn-helix transcriptional regulator [Noviherbaspirillum sp.]|uniref:helix-turn-helix domain-containing protein n=1 Tax=Noviherbaspirillum sp. TaxID=1926288 RepID=UPI002D5A7305|nr:helix-turn-helix transcriptional regulator [Noviherbaspirillum sp.]HYD96644.1 helix-turn-helix transcriptional regulator [Noviherbaspirillum sp.]